MANLGRSGHVLEVELIGADASGNDQRPRIIVDGVGTPRLAVDAAVTVAGLDMHLERNIQVQNDERPLASLGGSTTWNGASRDCEYYADFAISVYLARDSADTTVDVVVECSKDGATWREVDRQTESVTTGTTPVNVNRNYSVTRQYMRVSLVNNTANAVNAEVVSVQKPIG